MGKGPSKARSSRCLIDPLGPLPTAAAPPCRYAVGSRPHTHPREFHPHPGAFPVGRSRFEKRGQGLAQAVLVALGARPLRPPRPVVLSEDVLNVPRGTCTPPCCLDVVDDRAAEGQRDGEVAVAAVCRQLPAGGYAGADIDQGTAVRRVGAAVPVVYALPTSYTRTSPRPAMSG